MADAVAKIRTDATKCQPLAGGRDFSALWMQNNLFPLTAQNEMTKWVAGDLGLAFVLVSAVVAVIFRAKRDELPALTE